MPFVLPIRHLHAVVSSMASSKARVIVCQAVLPGQSEQKFPPYVLNKTFKTESLLWHKERLWNHGARLTDADYLLFIDADVLFGHENWIQESANLLEETDVIQPYENAVWLNQYGEPEIIRPSFVQAIHRNEIPKLNYFHPGFAWGMTRDFFERMGGFFDECVSGNGDTVFALSLRLNEKFNRVYDWISKNQEPWFTNQRYISYRKKVSELDASVNYTKCNLRHLWHGERKDRQYMTRSKLFDQVVRNNNGLDLNPEGLIEWSNPARANVEIRNYFSKKKDDG